MSKTAQNSAPQSPATPRKKHAGGRPTKYRKDYCQHVLKVIGEEGMPDLVAAGEIGVDVHTLADWATVHPEFSTAFKNAKALRARKHIGKRAMGQARWIFLAKNWCGLVDKQEIEHSGSMGITVDVDQAREKLKRLLAKAGAGIVAAATAALEGQE